MFLAGIAVAALGLTGLPARAGGPRLRRAAAVVTLAGVALAGTAVRMASTAQESAQGVVIPALHDAANDAPITYIPACGRAAGVPVCLNPAYGRYLPDVTAALAPVLAEVAGLPGAPVRAVQVAASYPSGGDGPPQPISFGGHPSVLRLQLGLLNMPGPCGFCAGPWPRQRSPPRCSCCSPTPSRARAAAPAARCSRPCRQRCCEGPGFRSPRSPG